MPKSLPIALALAAAATAAQAHITLETAEAPVGSTYKAVLRVPHGCAGEADPQAPGKAPRGRDRGQADAQARLEARDRHRPLRQARRALRQPVTEGVPEITWTGELPDAFYDEFVFRAASPPTSRPARRSTSRSSRNAPTASRGWIEIPAAGQDSEALENPAPGLTLLPAAAGDD